MTLADLKAAARQAAFARRKAAFAEGPGRAPARLAQVLAPHAGKPLAGYMPMRTELDPLPAMAAHAGPVGVPVIPGPAQALTFRAWNPEALMIRGEFGALIPETGVWIEPEILIVPLLAFDRRGFRLGYGGGFYDRTLEGLRAKRPTLAIGYAFAAQEVDKVPTEPTDQPLNLIVTEAGVIEIEIEI